MFTFKIKQYTIYYNSLCQEYKNLTILVALENGKNIKIRTSLFHKGDMKILMIPKEIELATPLTDLKYQGIVLEL